MRSNCKAVIHFPHRRALEVLFNCIALHFENGNAMRVKSLASFATGIIDRAELDVGGGRCVHLRLCRCGGDFERT